MSHRIEHVELPTLSPGTRQRITVHRFGPPRGRPKAYLQAGLHADEIPGTLVLSHLLPHLEAAGAARALRGEIVVVPCCNPSGLGQVVSGALLGRYELAGGGNFNRGWPELGPAVAAELAPRLGDDPTGNLAAVRAGAQRAVAALPATGGLEAWRRALLGLAVDADLVLDLHCDSDALVHLYTTPEGWPVVRELAAELGSAAQLLATESGDQPFDEVFSGLWRILAAEHPGRWPASAAPVSATVELRGTADVAPDLAEADARALLRFLTRRGLLAGEPGPLPALRREASPLEATELLRSPRAGILAYAVGTGDEVARGALVARVIDPADDDPLASAVELRAGTDGLVLTRQLERWTRPGAQVAKIVGTVPIRAGKLLGD
jgi:uncharacterized protein